MKSIEKKLRLHPSVIIRTPVFSLQTSLENKVEELKAYILDASPDFYQSISQLDSGKLLNLDNKIALSFYKYFNRAKFRPVPFGLFAAVSIVEDNGLYTKLKIGKKLNPKRFLDWDYTEHIKNLDTTMRRVNFLMANTTIYTVGNHHRYVSFNKGIFQIVEINSFPELTCILELCRERIAKKELFSKLKLKFNLNQRSITRSLTKLIQEQLLFHDLSPNIVGEDFFSRCNFHIPDTSLKSYIISERDEVTGSYRDASFEMMSELIDHLNANLPHPDLPYLEKFKRDFLRKFDRQFIPLSIAMDPELGVGYANLENSIDGSAGIDIGKIFSQNKSGHETRIQNSPYLLYALSRSSNKVVNMEEFDGEAQTKIPNLPNSLSILYHNYGSKPVIESIGGTSANNLLGRFTICNNKIHQLAVEIAEMEQRANPFISFFDVAYRGEKHVDNINRRQRIYEYELPLLTWTENNKVLNVEEIEVAVIDNEIILFSKKMKKRIIPRIPTAYNHHRSDLSIYRFLSDLQHQGLRSDLNLRLMDHFPGLKHYSRICYKQFILSPECWRLPSELINQSRKIDFESYHLKLFQWLESLRLLEYFKTGHGDKTLTFDPNRESDVKAFSLYCFHYTGTQIYIYEALIDSSSAIQTTDGENFAGQVLLTMCHKRQNFSHKNYSEKKINLLQRRLLPGSEWLYVEIYCHHMRTNQILISGISTFLKKNSMHLKKWFFLRYTKNGNHVRVRFHLKDSQKMAYILANLNSCINDYWKIGLISDFQVKTYQREMERYAFNYDRLEKFFYHDSKLVLNFLRREESNDFLHHFALNSMRIFLNEALTDFKQQFDFISLLGRNFANEFNFNKSSFKLINKEYENGKAIREKKHSFPKMSKQQLKVFNQIINECHDTNQKYAILADLIHLHINRIFSDSARGQEAILYQYILKDLKKSMHFSTNV